MESPLFNLRINDDRLYFLYHGLSSEQTAPYGHGSATAGERSKE
jgi:hypothetical protein